MGGLWDCHNEEDRTVMMSTVSHSDDNPLHGITFQPDIYAKVMALLPTDRTSRLLDVGAGEGFFCGMLRDHDDTDVTACDYQPALFRQTDTPFHRADLNHSLPFEDQSFECLISIEVIEHLENHFRFMPELLRVVRVGGPIIITTPNALSIPSRWHFSWTGFTGCARRPLDPQRQDYFLQHINPISLPELLFYAERFGGELIELTTNRRRRSARMLWFFLYPFFAITLRRKPLRRKHRAHRDLHRRHIRWMLSYANLTGRITIAVIERRA